MTTVGYGPLKAGRKLSIQTISFCCYVSLQLCAGVLGAPRPSVVYFTSKATKYALGPSTYTWLPVHGSEALSPLTFVSSGSGNLRLEGGGDVRGAPFLDLHFMLWSITTQWMWRPQARVRAIADAIKCAWPDRREPTVAVHVRRTDR